MIPERVQKAHNRLSTARLNSMYPTEDAILADVKEELILCGLPYVRAILTGRRGISDILVCANGKFVAIELKDDTGKPSANQIKFIDKINEAGGHAATCRTLAEVYKLIYNAYGEELPYA